MYNVMGEHVKSRGEKKMKSEEFDFKKDFEEYSKQFEGMSIDEKKLGIILN
jgi:hypothetical protein